MLRKRIVFFWGLFFVSSLVSAQKFRNISTKFQTPYELSGMKRTATYEECREWYRNLNLAFPNCTSLDSIGYGDAGLPIYVFRIYCSEKDPRLKILINNNIHPGEPEGTDASMLLAREILQNQENYAQVLSTIDLHIICQYNVDGTNNQSCCTRANQDGPENEGFRGNARNLDLNRDFIKMDSRNAKAFVKYFVKNKFHLFIDNHTSNGADYQYTLTYFHTRPEKLHPSLGNWMKQLDGDLKTELFKHGFPTSPYVETIKHVPDSGIGAFWETGRFATGFAALHHCLGFTVETHMLKPFPQRVNATYAFMHDFLQIAARKNATTSLVEIQKTIRLPQRNHINQKVYLQYHLNMKKADTISFLGYEYSHPISSLTGQPRLYYDRSKPWQKNIPYYQYFIPSDSAVLPKFYVIPYAWGEVISRLEMNGIPLIKNLMDSVLPANVSYIEKYESTKTPYEGHYLHWGVKTRDTQLFVHLRKGDVFIRVTEENAAFLAAVLEPRAPDSYFAWNFFDAVLQQKEGYSEYVWVDKAEEIIKQNSALKAAFEAKKKSDEGFAKDASAQLNWIYKNSPYYEKTHNLYPVYRF